MSGEIQVFGGECTTEFEGSRDRTRRGRVVVVVKPDNTVLVHDIDGYQPVTWLTRPETLAIDRMDGTIEASDADQHLRIRFHDIGSDTAHSGSVAGVPVGTTETGSALVRSRGAVVDLATDDRYRLPSGAIVLDKRCEVCGLPLVCAERGARFEVCLDRTCESLDDAVSEAFDRAWSCPDCGDDLRILRRAGLVAGCDSYPDCETGYTIPDGVIVGMCECELPVFETDRGQRCLADCEHDE